MSWSKTYTGTPQEALDSATNDIPNIEAPLPEFEKSDVQRVVAAAAILLHQFNPRSQITLSLSGHGYRNASDGTGGGAMAVSVGYTVGNAE